MLDLLYETISAEVDQMVISDGSLRGLNFIIRAHGETWRDDKYKHRNIASGEYRLMFIMQGEIHYEIFGEKYTVKKNQMLLIPERHNFSLWVPKDGYVHMQYCNFNAVLESESIFDYVEGDWIAEVNYPKEVTDLFNRFHCTDKNNLIMDCLEKRLNLLRLLTGFVRNAGIKTVESKTGDGDLLNGIALYIQRYDGPHPELTVEKLAKMANVHPHYFIAEFKKRFGKTPMQYAADVRVDKAKEYWPGTSLSIGEISELLSFADPKYFSKFFKRQTGVTPSEYRKSKSEKN